MAEKVDERKIEELRQKILKEIEEIERKIKELRNKEK